MVIEGRLTTKKQPNRKSPIANIAKISSLQRYPDRDYALDLLHQLAVAVGPIINHYKFKVGMLCEMYPKSDNLLGLNVNHGQKILIRLRQPFNDKLYFPMSDLIGTFLHELTHNIHGPHNASFYALFDELRTKYESGALLSSSYVCEENKLGGRSMLLRQLSVTVRQKRLDAVSKVKYKSETRTLGGPMNTTRPKDVRSAVAAAAERRLKDSKWCGGEVDLEELEEQDSDLTPKEKEEFKEVIDLTNEDCDVKDGLEPEVIVINACKTKSRSASPLTLAPSVSETGFKVKIRASKNPLAFSSCVPFGRSLSFSLSPPLSLSPGKMFIGEDGVYPRLKLVADIDIGRIIEWSENAKPKSGTKKAEQKKRAKVASAKVEKKSTKSSLEGVKRRTRKRPSPANSSRRRKEVRPVSFAELLGQEKKEKTPPVST